MDTCVFCAIIARQIPATIIAETDTLIVIQDRAPKAPVHYLIIPKKHIQDVRHLEKGDCCLSSQMFMMAQQLAFKDGKNLDFKLLVNNGHSAGQRVFHLHMHFLAGTLFQE